MKKLLLSMMLVLAAALTSCEDVVKATLRQHALENPQVQCYTSAEVDKIEEINEGIYNYKITYDVTQRTASGEVEGHVYCYLQVYRNDERQQIQFGKIRWESYDIDNKISNANSR